MMAALKKHAPPIVVLILLIGFLEGLTKGLHIDPTVLPSPSQMLTALVAHFVPDLMPHMFNTIGCILSGFLIGVPLGMVLAALFSQFGLLTKTFTPYVIILSTTPLLTLIPLFRLWLGFASWVKIVVVVVQIVPIITLNSVTGFCSVHKEKLELMESYGATRWESFWKVTFPSALPFIFTGCKLGIIFATIATISCELNGFSEGLGSRVSVYSKFLQTDVVFAVIILIAVVGIVLFDMISFVEQKVVTWKTD